jgi:hypothetical protein
MIVGVPIKTYKDLKVFGESYRLALDVLALREDFLRPSSLNWYGNCRGRHVRSRPISWAGRNVPRPPSSKAFAGRDGLVR